MVQRRSCRGALWWLTVKGPFFPLNHGWKNFNNTWDACKYHVRNRMKFVSQLKDLPLNSALQIVMRPPLSMLLNGCHPRARQRSSCRGRPWCHRLLKCAIVFFWREKCVCVCVHHVYVKIHCMKKCITHDEYQRKYIWFTWFGDT